MIASLKSLTSLLLVDNHIGDEGVREIASLPSLTSLNLTMNDFGEKGVRALLEAWSKRPDSYRIESLDLAGNDLGNVLPEKAFMTEDAQAILAAYREIRESPKDESR